MTDIKIIDVEPIVDAAKDLVKSELAQSIIGLAGGDWIIAKRRENAHHIAYKTEQRLKERGIKNVNVAESMNLKFCSSFIEKATLEEDDFIQDKWAEMLFKKLDPNNETDVKHQYIEILSRLDADDLKLLNEMYKASIEYNHKKNEERCFNRQNLIKGLKISEKDMEKHLIRFMSLGLIKETRVPQPYLEKNEYGEYPTTGQGIEQFRFSEIGYEFCEIINENNN